MEEGFWRGFGRGKSVVIFSVEVGSGTPSLGSSKKLLWGRMGRNRSDSVSIGFRGLAYGIWAYIVVIVVVVVGVLVLEGKVESGGGC